MIGAENAWHQWHQRLTARSFVLPGGSRLEYKRGLWPDAPLQGDVGDTFDGDHEGGGAQVGGAGV